MRNMMVKAAQWPIRAFTLLESLMTLAVVVFLTLSLAGSVTGIFQQVEINLFYLRFEYLYRDSQRLASSEGSNVELQLTKNKVSNGRSSLLIPKSIHLDKGQTLVFDAKGGNSSLTKIRFSSDKEVVTYLLNMGSGKYKKTIS
ncbi:MULTISPECIES: competence type IV pilus minor pilin ComGD [Streptococcus]|uniref:competence type IV pilus minor pilin ComGD n=1 Tax=Streptococcus TaxID=1301 RepID=UPI0030FD035C